ncbi:glutamate-rich protein 6-like isoform X2 [Osmerus eperlanus]|uniref:glutamate-rich protein 6-like isoform X2 n=1 Tax=Osmerus eperlanus TaxID=29151 RepID=UPI002E145426
MSQRPSCEDEEGPPSSLVHTKSSSSLELTVENVQELEQQFGGTGSLYSSSVEYYVEDTQHCSQMDGETEKVCVGADEKFQIDLRTGAQNIKSRSSSNGDLSEYEEVHAFDGRVVVRVSTRSQTDWDWVAKSSTKNKLHTHDQTVKNISNPVEESLAIPHAIETAPNTKTLLETEGSEVVPSLNNRVLDMTSKAPSAHLAVQGEHKQSPPSCDMIAEVSNSDSSGDLLENDLDSIRCEYCQQFQKPAVLRDQMKHSTPEEEEDITMDTISHLPFKGAKDLAEQRLKEWEIQRTQTGSSNCTCSGVEAKLHNTICYRLSNEVFTAEETALPEMEIINPPDTVTPHEEEQGHKKKDTLIRLYDSGQTFLTIFPDGTGQVFYPSGRLAILICAVNAVDFTYVILADKALQSDIKAIFTSKGQSTCYHPNGLIWVNLTQLGGTSCSDTGALRRRWSWIDHEHHVHAPPIQPLCLSLNPNIEIRIQTQDCIYLTFTSHKCSVRLNVGSRFKMDPAEGLMLPGPDLIQRHLQLKSAEIYSFLQKIQSVITYQQPLSPRKLTSQSSLISQLEMMRTAMHKRRAAKTSRVLVSTNSQ